MNRVLFLLILLLLPCLLPARKKGPLQRRNDEDKKVNVAFIPIVTYNRSFGMQFGAMAGMYYDLNRRDTISPACVLR